MLGRHPKISAGNSILNFSEIYQSTCSRRVPPSAFSLLIMFFYFFSKVKVLMLGHQTASHYPSIMSSDNHLMLQALPNNLMNIRAVNKLGVWERIFRFPRRGSALSNPSQSTYKLRLCLHKRRSSLLVHLLLCINTMWGFPILQCTGWQFTPLFSFPHHNRGL